MDRSNFRDLKTRSWHTIEFLGKVGAEPSLEVIFHNLPEPDLPEPEEAAAVRAEVWAKQLQKRKADLEAQNTGTLFEIGPDYITGSQSLYEWTGIHPKTIMFDGSKTNTTLARAGHNIDGNQITIHNFEIPYSKWIACLDPRYGEAYDRAGLPLPYAGLGISTLIIPSDGMVALTRRGRRTPIYPDMLYCPGGGVKPGLTSAEAAIDELVTETGLKQGTHFQAENILPVAFVADTHHSGSRHARPEVLYMLKADLTSKEIAAVYAEHVRAKGKEPDVSNIEYYLASNADNTQRTIAAYGKEMCPPTAASFAYLLYTQLLEGADSEEIAFSKLREFLAGVSFDNIVSSLLS